MLLRASGSDCVGGRRPVAASLCSPPPRTSCVRFLRTQRSMPECSAIACGREGAGRGDGAPDELQRAEEGWLVCVRECARARIQIRCRCASRAAQRQHDKIKPKSAYKKLKPRLAAPLYVSV